MAMKRFLLCFGLVAFCAASPEVTHVVISEGADPIVEVGDTLTVHATGFMIGSGFSVANIPQQFSSTKDSGQQPFTYTEGGAVITGWDTGARGMKLGEVRDVTIPADVAAGISDAPYWLHNGGYGNDGFPADTWAGSQEYYESFAAFKNAASPKLGNFWDTSEVEGVEVDGNHPHKSDGTCTQWTAFAPGRQGNKNGRDGPEGSQVRRIMHGSGTAVLELEDCYGDGHVHPDLAGTGTQVFYKGQQVGPTIKGQKHTFKFEFEDGYPLVIGEVHSIWKVHSFKIYRDLKVQLEVLDTFKYTGSISGVKSNPDLMV